MPSNSGMLGRSKDRGRISSGVVGVPGPAGADGVSITGAVIDTAGHLILTLSDGAEINAGYAKGDRGERGPTGPEGPMGPSGSSTGGGGSNR